MVAVRDFSGLVSSPWALARADAMAPMGLLERCMADLRVQDIKANGAGFGAFGPHPMPRRFPGVLRHQAFQFSLGVLMLQECRSGLAILSGEFRPSVGCTHVDDAHGLDTATLRDRK